MDMIGAVLIAATMPLLLLAMINKGTDVRPDIKGMQRWIRLDGKPRHRDLAYTIFGILWNRVGYRYGSGARLGDSFLEVNQDFPQVFTSRRLLDSILGAGFDSTTRQVGYVLKIFKRFGFIETVDTGGPSGTSQNPQKTRDYMIAEEALELPDIWSIGGRSNDDVTINLSIEKIRTGLELFCFNCGNYSQHAALEIIEKLCEPGAGMDMIIHCRACHDVIADVIVVDEPNITGTTRDWDDWQDYMTYIRHQEDIEQVVNGLYPAEYSEEE